jgi:hypothetical protein
MPVMKKRKKQTNDAPIKEKKKKKKLSVPEAIAFVEANILRPDGSNVICRHVVGLFFRVNFFVKVDAANDCVIDHYDLVDSRFIRVGSNGDGLKIIDKTISKKPLSPLQKEPIDENDEVNSDSEVSSLPGSVREKHANEEKSHKQVQERPVKVEPKNC